MGKKAENPIPLARRLKEYRERAGLSQEELAKKAGVTGACVSRVESGRRQLRGLETLFALAKGLGVSADELAGRSTFQPPGEEIHFAMLAGLGPERAQRVYQQIAVESAQQQADEERRMERRGKRKAIHGKLRESYGPAKKAKPKNPKSVAVRIKRNVRAMKVQ